MDFVEVLTRSISEYTDNYGVLASIALEITVVVFIFMWQRNTFNRSQEIEAKSLQIVIESQNKRIDHFFEDKARIEKEMASLREEITIYKIQNESYKLRIQHLEDEIRTLREENSDRTDIRKEYDALLEEVKTLRMKVMVIT